MLFQRMGRAMGITSCGVRGNGVRFILEAAIKTLDPDDDGSISLQVP